MKLQLDDQDKLLTGIRDARTAFKVNKRGGIILVAGLAFANGLIEVIKYLAEHWS